MRKLYHSLETKLILSFVLLIVVITLGTFLFTFSQTKNALLDSTKDDMLQKIGLVSTQVSAEDIDKLLQFKPGDDQSPEYQAMISKFVYMRSLSPDLINFYAMVIDGNTITFAFDDAEDDAASIGQIYENPDPELFKSVSGLSVSKNFYTDEWGTFLSGYAPLKTLDNGATLVIGADMEATSVIERQNFIGETIYFIMGGAILIAAIIIGLFSVTIIRDIRKLSKTANEISKGNTNVSVDVVRKDEIGELAESFSRMVASLKIMLGMHAEDTSDSRK